jgi:hypothetical protein
MSEPHNLTRQLFDAVFTVMPYVNGLMGLYIVGYLVFRLLRYPTAYNRAERVAMGAIAGGIVMATPAIWMPDTPFDGWSFNVARFGVLLYIVTGGIRRDRHAVRNAELNRIAGEYLAERRASKGRP